MQKTAHYYRGQAAAFLELGFAPEKIARVLVAEGLSKTAADTMIKEAIPFIGGLLSGAKGLLGKGLGAIGSAAPNVGRVMGNAGSRIAASGPGAVRGFFGKQVGQMGGMLSRGMQQFSQAPGQAASGFGKNLLRGAFGAGGQGTLGGMTGRGLNYAATAQGLYGLMGGGRQPQQQVQG
jgi:hypothetical protein